MASIGCMLRWMVPHQCMYEQHKLDSLGYFFKENMKLVGMLGSGGDLIGVRGRNEFEYIKIHLHHVHVGDSLRITTNIIYII